MAALPPRKPDAQVAQLVEHATENRSVGGSIPPLGTIPFATAPSTEALRFLMQPYLRPAI